VLADVRRDTQRLHCAVLVPPDSAGTHEQLNRQLTLLRDLHTTSKSCAARRHGQLAAFKQEGILPIAGFAPLDDTTQGLHLFWER
jgi:hypothetical protein